MPDESLRTILATVIFAYVVYGLYLILDRLLFSPLSSIPGPRLAALTGWYETFHDVVLPGRYVFRIRELHNQYGPIVRINPREVSISDCEFLDVIYNPGSGEKRDKDFEKVKALGINASVGGAWQHDLHHKRRLSLNPYFSQAMVLRHEPQLLLKKQQLSKAFADAQSKDFVNLSDVYFAFASDVVSQYSFGHNQNVLLNLPRAHAMRINVQNVLRSVKVNLSFGWLRPLIMSLPHAISKHFAPAGAADMIRFRMAVRKNVENVINDAAQTHGTATSVFQELLDSPRLPAAEKSVQRLEDEGTLLVMAGTESTAKSLTLAHYYLLANPDILEKLRAELKGVPDASLRQLLQLPYLNAIATEANRLSFGLTGRNPRVAHETIQYVDPGNQRVYRIPAGTPISTSTILSNANEDIFPNPWAFHPDRWLSDLGQRRKKYMLSFGKGPRLCLGINLAYAELAIAIVEMANWDLKLHQTNEDDVLFAHDYHVAHPRLDSQGVRAKILGQVSGSASTKE